jgi:hypothetical protein
MIWERRGVVRGFSSAAPVFNNTGQARKAAQRLAPAQGMRQIKPKLL